MVQSTIDFVPSAEGERGDPLILATEHLTRLLGPGGEVRKAGYPALAEDGNVYIFERDGRTRGITSPSRAGEGWLFGSHAVCADDL